MAKQSFIHRLFGAHKTKKKKIVHVSIVALIVASIAIAAIGGGVLLAVDNDKNSGSPFTPTFTTATTSDVLTVGDGDVWYFNVEAGSTYRFSLCAAEGGSGAFDTTMNVDYLGDQDTYNDDYCSLQSQAQFTANSTEVIGVRVGSYSSSYGGAYTLAYKRLPSTLNAPTSTYQTTDSTDLDNGDTAYYEMAVEAGKTYKFSFCEGGGSATNVQPDWTVDGSESTSTPCGAGETEMTYTAVSTTTISLNFTNNSGSNGSYVLAYKWDVPVIAAPNANNSFSFHPTSGTNSLDAGATDTFVLPVVNGYYYTLSLCSIDGGSVDFSSTATFNVNNGSATSYDCSGGFSDQRKVTHYYPGFTGDMTVQITNNGGTAGTYKLAYRIDPAVLTPSTSYGSTVGAISADDEVDYYMLAVENGKNYKVTLCESPGTVSSGFDMQMDVGGTVNNDACTDGAEVVYTSTTNGYVDIALSATDTDSTGSYTLAFKWDLPSLPTPTDSFQEYPLSPDPANTLNAGESDYFVMPVVSGNYYTVSTCSDFGGTATFDTVVRLDNGGAASDNDCTNGYASTVSHYYAWFTGDMVVQVENIDASSGSYRLSFRQDPPLVTTPTTSFQQQQGSLDSAAEVDRFLMAVQSGKDYLVSFCQDSGETDIDVQLTVDGQEGNDDCANGEEVSYSASTTGNIEITISATTPAETNSSPYTFVYKEVVPALNTPTATLQTTGVQTLTDYATDTYLVNLEAGKEYLFTTCNNYDAVQAAAFDTVIAVYTTGGVYQTANDDENSAPYNCGNKSRVLFTPGSTDTYEIRVYAYSFGVGGNYELGYKENVSAFTPTSTYQTDITGTIASQGSTDNIDVTVEAGKTYRFSLCPANSGSVAFTPSWLVDGAATGVTTLDTCGTATEMVYTATADATVSVDLTADTGSGSYTMAYKWDVESLVEPTTSFQTLPSSPRTISAGGTDYYVVDVVSGTSYTFSFCNENNGTGSATFNTTLDVDGTVSTDTCGDQGGGLENLLSEVQYTAATTGEIQIAITDAGGVGGNYTLAYRQTPPPLTPTGSYQTVSGTIASQGLVDSYVVNVFAGTPLEFTFCDGGASTAFTPDLGMTGAGDNTANCGAGLKKMKYLPPVTGTATLNITASTGSGAYTLAYKTIPTISLNSSFQNATGSIDTAGESDWQYFYVESGKPYKVTLCENGASADFTPALDVLGESDTPAVCGGSLTETTFVASGSDVIPVQITATSGTGNYTMAGRWDVAAISATTTFQTVAGTVGTGETDQYIMAMEAGKYYLMSFCQGGGDADFATTVNVAGQTSGTGTYSCGSKSERLYYASSTTDYTIEVGENDGTGGSYTLAYKELATITPSSTGGTISGQISADGRALHRFARQNGKDYRFSLCPTYGGSATFDSVMDFDSGSATGDDQCGDDAEITYSSLGDTTSDLVITSKDGSAGSYTLYYEWDTVPLNPQFDVWQQATGSFALFTPEYFAVNVEAGQVYDFSTCAFGGGNDTDVEISVDGNVSSGFGCQSLYSFIPDESREYEVQIAADGDANGTVVMGYRSRGWLLPDPTLAFQTVSRTLPPNGRNTFGVNMTAGKQYELSLCSADNGGSTATFDNTISVDGGSTLNTDACDGTSETVTFLASTSDYIYVDIEGVSGAGGDYTFAFREVASGSSASLPEPTTTYQQYEGTLTPTTTDTLSIEVVSGNTYEISFCGINGNAAFDAVLNVDPAGTTVYSDNYCGDLPRVSYTAASNGTIDIEVSSADGVSGGAYVFDYGIRNGAANANSVIYVSNEQGTDVIGCGANTTTGACQSLQFASIEGGTNASRSLISVQSGNQYTFTDPVNFSYDNIEFYSPSIAFQENVSISDNSGVTMIFQEATSATFASGKVLDIGTQNSLAINGTRRDPVIFIPAIEGAGWGGIFSQDPVSLGIDNLKVFEAGGSVVCDGGDDTFFAGLCIQGAESGGSVTISNSEFANQTTGDVVIALVGETASGQVNIGTASGGNYFHGNTVTNLVGYPTANGQIQYANVYNNFFDGADFQHNINIYKGDNSATHAFNIVNNLFTVGANGTGINIGSIDGQAGLQFAYNTFTAESVGSGTGISWGGSNTPASSNIFYNLATAVTVSFGADSAAITNNLFDTVTTADGGAFSGLLPVSNITGSANFIDGPNFPPYFNNVNTGDDYYLNQGTSAAVGAADPAVPFTNYLAQGTTRTDFTIDLSPFDIGFHYNEGLYKFTNVPDGYTSSETDEQSGNDVPTVISDSSARPRLRIVGDFYDNEADVDLSLATIDGDSSRTVVDVSAVSGIEGTHTIYIPNTNSGAGIYYCPTANVLAEVDPGCAGVVTIANGGTDAGTGVSVDLVAADGETPTGSGGFYRLQGVTGSGGGTITGGGDVIQWATQELTGADVVLYDIPDNFSFPAVQVGDNTNSFNNIGGTDGADSLIVLDQSSTDAGFQIQIQANDFVGPGGATIANENLFVVTTPSASAGLQANGVTHTTPAQGAAIAPLDVDAPSPQTLLGTASTFTTYGTDLDSPAIILSTTDPTGITGFEVDVSFFLQVPQFQTPGTYSGQIVYTLLLN